jgi:hypothetical protein
MLFFELFPVALTFVLLPVGIWLVAMDRQARAKPVAEQTTQLRRMRPRS